MKLLNNFLIQRANLSDLSENKIITLANIYAPNKDDPNFLKNVYNRLMSFESGDIIVGGDFNLVQDVQLDIKKGGNRTTHFRAQQEVENIKTNLD